MQRIAVCCIFLLTQSAGWLDAQAVLSRRDYAAQGRTWRQLWIANSGTTEFRQLTHTARDHAEPLCSRDGKLIYFVSDRDGYPLPQRICGCQRPGTLGIRQTKRPGAPGVANVRRRWFASERNQADGAVLAVVGTELRSLLRHPRQIGKIDPAYNAASVSPDGRTLAIVIAGSLDKQGQNHDAKLFLVDTATGRSRVSLGNYQAPAWSPDGRRIAAFAEDGPVIVDVATRKEIVRVRWPKPTPLPKT